MALYHHAPGHRARISIRTKRSAERAIFAGIAKRRNYADSKTASIKPRNAPGRVSGDNAGDSLQRARTLERVRLA